MASASFAPLRHKSFVLALSANFISSTGTWMQSVALGVYLTITTHNPLWLGLLTLSAWLPALIGSPLGGVMADRISREKWIQLNNLIQALAAAALAVAELLHHLSPLLACLLAIAEGLCGSASWAAWQSLMRDLVNPDEVLAAVSLSSAQFNLGRIIGPVIAAALLTLGNPGWCFVANAASFVVVVATFSFVRSPARNIVPSAFRPVHDTVVGLRAMFRTPGARNAIVGVGLLGFFVSPFITLVPAMGIDVLHAGKSGVSWMVTAQGVGAVIGALTLPAIARRTSRLAVLRASLWTAGIAEALYAYAPTIWLSSAALVIMGGAYVGCMTGLNTSVQVHAPEQERSRVLSMYVLSLSIFYPIGAVLQSALAKTWGVQLVSVLGAGAFLVILAITTFFHPHHWRVMGPATESPLVLVAE
jgi:MFS family permease